MVPIFQMVLPRPSRASPCFHVRRNPAFPRFGAVASPDKTRSGYHPRDRPSGAVSPGIWGVREGGKSAYMLPNMPHGRRVSDAFPRQAHIRGGDIGDGSRAAPSRTPSRRIAAGGAVAQAPAPDTDRPRAAASCHARGTLVHAACAPAPPWPPGRPLSTPGQGWLGRKDRVGVMRL